MDRIEDLGLAHRLTRRELVARGGYAAITAGGLAALAGCGSSGSTSVPAKAQTESISGTLNYLTYPGWIGKHEYSGFQKLHPQAKIHEIAYNGSSTRGLAVLVRENPSAYDFLGAVGLAAIPTLTASPSLVAKLDWSKIPNIKNIPQRFRSEYPYGVPTDYGKVGFAYRKDLMPERPTSWAELWQLAPKYSGKIIFVDAMEDVMGNTLKMLGYSGNSVVPAQITAAKNKLLEIKPHLQAILSQDVAKPITKGTAVMTMDYDFDIALSQQQEPNIEWVAPKEGLMAYLEGQVAVASSKHLAAIEAFMNFNMEPPNYADFVDTTGTAYLMPAASPLVKKTISGNPVLAFSSDVLARVEFEKSLGAATGLWTTAWSEFHAA
jgi:spermidine/putrescine transport system substrate-binding protein